MKEQRSKYTKIDEYIYVCICLCIYLLYSVDESGVRVQVCGCGGVGERAFEILDVIEQG